MEGKEKDLCNFYCIFVCLIFQMFFSEHVNTYFLIRKCSIESKSVTMKVPKFYTICKLVSQPTTNYVLTYPRDL